MFSYKNSIISHRNSNSEKKNSVTESYYRISVGDDLVSYREITCIHGPTQGRPLQFMLSFPLSFLLKPPHTIKLKNILHLHRFYNLFVIKQLQSQKNQKGEPLGFTRPKIHILPYADNLKYLQFWHGPTQSKPLQRIDIGLFGLLLSFTFSLSFSLTLK